MLTFFITRVKTLYMARPTEGEERKKDVTLTLNRRIYSDAKVFAKKRRRSVSSLVDELLEKEITAAKKSASPQNRALNAASQDSTGSIPSYRMVEPPSGIALISEDPESTPSSFFSGRSRK
jgi:hypothetical protein